MDTGGLAHMSSNQNNNNANIAPPGNLAMAGSSFSSRGKGAHIKRLSVAPSATMGSIDENEVDNPAPRTSRSHLLAGLRTAPKQNNQAVPASAPYDQTQHLIDSITNGSSSRHDAPQTATTPIFSGYGHGFPGAMNDTHQIYQMPEHILAPPTMNFNGDETYHMDQHAYNELMTTKMLLAQRQQQLQQQLMSVNAAAQHFQGMNLNGGPMSNPNGVYNQQLQNGMQPIIQPVPNQAGLHMVYNPLTGQTNYFMDNGMQQYPHSSSPQMSGMGAPPEPQTPSVQQRDGTPPSAASAGWTRPISSSRQTPSPPQDVTPLPAPSANAYRPGHRKSVSSVNKAAFTEPLKSAGPRTAGLPQTPLTGTFGPGMGRAGEHPIRQPRGPPPLDELLAKPVSTMEGSKNFASRQRRAALSNLFKARSERRFGQAASANGESSPASENDQYVSDGDSDNGSSKLSSHSSVGSFDASAEQVNGSGEKQEKHSLDTISFASRLADSVHSVEECNSISDAPNDRKKTPILVLTSAEKRKSTVPPLSTA